ncbi:MAG: transposase [Candidatus Hydrogenedentota bacterium]
MRSRYKFHEQDAAYFLTCTIVEWTPVFQSRPYFDVIVHSLEFCRREKALRVYAYVIMENHVHLIVAALNPRRVIQAFKGFTAREIIRLAETDGRTGLLKQFTAYKKRYKADSTYQVWQEGSHPQRILDDEMLNQKLEYIHNNPVRRGYVDLPEHWRYSSARNYYLDDHSVLEIDLLPM